MDFFLLTEVVDNGGSILGTGVTCTCGGSFRGVATGGVLSEGGVTAVWVFLGVVSFDVALVTEPFFRWFESPGFTTVGAASGFTFADSTAGFLYVCETIPSIILDILKQD